VLFYSTGIDSSVDSVSVDVSVEVSVVDSAATPTRQMVGSER
jgi:hypothetical protein